MSSTQRYSISAAEPQGRSPYRLLALDLDGTIISLDLQVDPRDEAALARARERGLLVAACTGRPYSGAVRWVEHLHLTEPLICYQGAQVRAADGSLLLDHGIPHELAMEVVHFCRERRLHLNAYRDDRLLVEHDTPDGRAYARHSGLETHVVSDLDLAMGPTSPKLVIVAAEEVVEALLPEVRERWRGRLFVATSLPTYLEMTMPGAHKGTALEFLAGYLQVPREQVVAAGDGRNDRPMLEWAGLAVAVEGAPAEVLEVADRVIGPPGTGGVAELLESL
ncbi:MAG: HAD family phosphatase [Chloroflexi bacterium]|nr:MAG: HAD family phosphatase [Chloroflexota bacterium]TME19651.1 MAG: HAD family phosphatase [Chloroflexota bacterium]